MHNPSLFKYIVASFKKGIFKKEDRYVKMCEQVEKMKDVNTIVKLQMLLTRLIPKTKKKVTQ